MPFKSEAQRRYLWANEPEIARDWADTYGSKIQAAQGGRAGYYAGGQSIPSEYTVEDARKTAMQDKLGGITDVMKQADLYRQGDVGQMYMANGGIMRLPFRFGGGYQGSPGGAVERGSNTAGDDKSYQTVQRPNPHLRGGTSLTSQVTGPRIGSSANEWIQNLNQQNVIRAAQEGTKFRPYQGGSRPQGGFWSGVGGIGNTLLGMINPLWGIASQGITSLKNKFGPAWKDWMGSEYFNEFLNKRRARKLGTSTHPYSTGDYENAGITSIDNSMYGGDQNTFDLEKVAEMIEKARADDYYTGNISFEEQIARNKQKLEELGFTQATWNDQ